jgi:GrpB-like predicted nucleotidyltransferase (UPF0157 family)
MIAGVDKYDDALGLPRGIVKLVPHDSRWAVLFRRERDLLAVRLNGMVSHIEHVGSTAVPGLDAKRILDIVVALHDGTALEAAQPKLEELGYLRRPNGDLKGRAFYAKGSEHRRTHHLSVTHLGSETWNEQTLFRDHLRANKDTMERYQDLKRSLAERHPTDRPLYTSLKDEFIKAVLEEANQTKLG